MNENQNLRDQLFPDGIPEPEEFIRVIANYIRENRPAVDDNKVPNGAEVI